MDPKSTYLLEIKLLGNPKKVRKDVRCFCFDKVVDSDTTNLKDLVDEITDQYPPGYLEVAYVQYYNEDLKSFPVVNTDQELMLMFESPAMATRSKKVDSSSPAMSTRSKRRLSL